SRFTGSPGCSEPSALRSSVSRMTSKLISSRSISTTVRQTPLTAIESPSLVSVTTSGPRTRSSALRPPGTQPSPVTSPSSSPIPVNMSATLRQSRDAQVGPDPADIDDLQVHRLGDGDDAGRGQQIGRAHV